MKRWRTFFIAVVLISITGQSPAQKRASGQLQCFSFPDFLHTGLNTAGDTSWSYEYYNKDLHRIMPANLKDVSDIDEVKYYKTYKPSEAEVSGAYRPQLFELVCRYVQVDTNIWLRVDPKTRKMQRYQMYPDKLVSKDTVKFADPITGKQRKVIYKYFKTAAIGKK